MKKLILIASLLLSSNSFSIEINENKTPCSKDENIEAYLFGQRIVDTVRNKDLDGLFSLAIDGELMWGPRKSFVEDKEFEQIFDLDWIDKVLKQPPDCGRVGWRGWMLAYGHVWYENFNGEFKIFGIYGAVKEETPNDLPIGWRYNGKIFPHESFVTEWISSDNFEEFEEHFKIETKDCHSHQEYGFTHCKSEDFRNNPGKYFGKEIKDLDPIMASWDDYISLAVSVQSLDFNRPYEIIDKQICTEQADPLLETFYEILGVIENDKCQELAPYMKGRCKESYLLYLGDWQGGSMGYTLRTGIYGLFALDDGEEYIVPLKYFSNENYALNYLDKQKVN